ncbi:hypothetical protein ABZ297_13355 [Nonomuraea sp. NPDC005983]|uniref:hypothetical protein n=1 Tax=Nonomuraea sp. NPDC005983 TaxID=3155595 RepID=UPI0033AF0D3A
MGDQFDVIESGTSGQRRWAGIAVLVVLLAVPVIGILVSREPQALPAPRPTPTPLPSLTTVANPPNVLHAKAKGKGGDEVIEVVFPNGARAEVRYPAALALDELGARPFQGMWVGGEYRILVAPYAGEFEITRGGQPIRSLTPNVTLWSGVPGSGPNRQVLLFAFGRWRLAMYDQPGELTFEQRLAVAEGLRGKVVGDGYLVLSAKGGARLAAPGETVQGIPVGPQLWFGGGAGEVLLLIPTPHCRPAALMPADRRGRPTKAVCRGGVGVVASGPDRFVKQALQGIRITLK